MKDPPQSWEVGRDNVPKRIIAGFTRDTQSILKVKRLSQKPQSPGLTTEPFNKQTQLFVDWTLLPQ